ncbi:MAG: hypothetical protein RLZZ243_352 [Bacteroidota bacterium]|jgi:hypothetical protein
MKKLVTLLFLLFATLQWSELVAQVTPADTNLYRVVKYNNQEYIGRILNDDGREVLLETTALGKIYIIKSDIQSITLVNRASDFVGDEYRGTGVFTTRYQFSTNAFPLQKHENYALVNLYGPEVHFSVSKNFSVGFIATWIASPIVLALKYTIPTRNEKLNFGFGTLLGSAGYLNQGRGYGGLHWAMATYGDRKNNVTLSLGYSYLNTGIQSGEQMYEPGTYPITLTNGYWGFVNLTPINFKTPTIKAPILGIAGLASVGKKASFVFDMMFIFGKKVEENRSQIYQYVYDPITGDPSHTYVGPINSETKTTNSLNCLIMPGMRFQKTENTAFQVSLAGVIGYSTTQSSGQLTSKRYSFPVPMCTWFYKF